MRISSWVTLYIVIIFGSNHSESHNGGVSDALSKAQHPIMALAGWLIPDRTKWVAALNNLQAVRKAGLWGGLLFLSRMVRRLT